MLADRRAHVKLRGFFLQWLRLDQLAELPKDAKLFPGFDGDVVSDLQTSLELFLEESMWSEKSDFRQLLLAEHLYLNGRLAKLYGGDLPVEAPFQKISSPMVLAAPASSLHPLLLANYAYNATSSPIHRGVFLARNVLGVSLRPPPDAFAPFAPDLHPKPELPSLRTHCYLQTSPEKLRHELGYCGDQPAGIHARELRCHRPFSQDGQRQARSMPSGFL